MVDGIIENLRFPYSYRLTDSLMASFVIFENCSSLSDRHFISLFYRQNKIIAIYY
jgi:hypothetical protein